MPKSPQFNRAVDRTNALTVLSIETPDKDKPSAKCAAYEAERPDREMVRTVYGGTKAMREAKEVMLPRHPREEQADWERRKEIAVSFNAFERTVKGLTGMVFRRDPEYQDVPDGILPHFDNIDLQGRALPVWARDVFVDALIDGGIWAHIEMPAAREFRNKLEEQEAGRRPYWLALKKQDVINWRYEMQDGSPVLTLFVYCETTMRDDGAYGSEEVEQFRVLRPGTWEVWEKGEKEYVMVESGATSLDYIPVAYFATKREGIYRSSPPLLDLAYENIEAYRVRSEARTALSFTIPSPVFIGVDKKSMEMGAGRALFFPNAEASAQMLESTGAALNEWREERKEIRGNEAMLGLSMLYRDTRAAETAQSKEIDKSEADSQLAAMARGLEDFLENCLAIHGDYLGVQDVGGIRVNDKFRHLHLDPQTLAQLHEMVKEGNLTQDTLWAVMVELEALPEDFDPEVERELLESAGADEIMNLTRTLSALQAERVRDEAEPEPGETTPNVPEAA